MEVVCWDHQAKAPTQRFPSISDSITHSLHDLGQIACSLTCRSISLLEIRSVHSLCFNCPQEKKANTASPLPEHLPGTKLYCSENWPRWHRTGRQMDLYAGSAPMPSPSRPRVPTTSSADRCLFHTRPEMRQVFGADSKPLFFILKLFLLSAEGVCFPASKLQFLCFQCSRILAPYNLSAQEKPKEVKESCNIIYQPT